MAQTINTNVASLTAQRNLNQSQQALNTSLERLSSGLRINSAKDDAAGLAISERFTAQIRGMDQAARNANDGISMAQTAEGSLQEVTSNLQRIRELSVQSANASNSSSDRAALQLEVAQLVEEIDRVATQTNFNGVNLLDGSFSAQAFQVGANAGQTITVSEIASALTSSLGQGTTAEVSAALSGAVSGLTINGTTVADASTTTTFAEAINDADAGVTATVDADNVAAGEDMTGVDGTAGAGTVTINGETTATVTLTGTEDTDRDLIVAAINLLTDDTGVVAENTGADATGITLTAADGSDIVASLTQSAAGTGGDGFAADTTGIAVGTDRGTISLSSDAAIVVGGTVTNSGLTAATTEADTISGTLLSALDISTSDGANTALASIDNALDTINTSRADLGAIQNRFESVVRSLQTTSENLSASRSRIQDADFAAETAALTKGQILQQAGTAMLAQANSLPQNVLSLLG